MIREPCTEGYQVPPKIQFIISDVFMTRRAQRFKHFKLVASTINSFHSAHCCEKGCTFHTPQHQFDKDSLYPAKSLRVPVLQALGDLTSPIGSKPKNPLGHLLHKRNRARIPPTTNQISASSKSLQIASAPLGREISAFLHHPASTGV
jgi:hypothetical protein